MKTFVGNPFISCRLFEKADLCKPNPCGSNAICTPGFDRNGNERPVCTCPPGYQGNALSSCTRGECQDDNECPDHRACINYMCVDPCIGKRGVLFLLYANFNQIILGKCGSNANCVPKNHLAVCKFYCQ